MKLSFAAKTKADWLDKVKGDLRLSEISDLHHDYGNLRISPFSSKEDIQEFSVSTYEESSSDNSWQIIESFAAESTIDQTRKSYSLWRMELLQFLSPSKRVLRWKNLSSF